MRYTIGGCWVVRLRLRLTRSYCWWDGYADMEQVRFGLQYLFWRYGGRYRLACANEPRQPLYVHGVGGQHPNHFPQTSTRSIDEFVLYRLPVQCKMAMVPT